MNTEEQHADLITDLLKPGTDVLAQLDSTHANLIHLALGIAGEAGELVDAIKKAAIYGKPLDMENVMEELGDLEFYQGALRQACGYTREMVLDHNIAKLRKRYGVSYSNEAAQERGTGLQQHVGHDAFAGVALHKHSAEMDADAWQVADRTLRGLAPRVNHEQTDLLELLAAQGANP